MYKNDNCQGGGGGGGGNGVYFWLFLKKTFLVAVTKFSLFLYFGIKQ